MRRRKPKILRPVRPNVGIEYAYQRRIDRLIDRMHLAIVLGVQHAWSSRPPVLAQDESPAAALQAMMDRLGSEWEKRFAEFARGEARHFAWQTKDHADRAFAAEAARAGFTVEFKMTRAAQDLLTATIAEQVNLIKSIASEHLTQVQGIVMRGAQIGRDLHHISQALQDQFGVTKRRAALIARDQSNKATATIIRARQADLGIVEAIWMHSHGGRVPRRTHLANDGKRYRVATGWLDPEAVKVPGGGFRAEWVWPGTLINCRCVTGSIIPELDER